MTLPKKIYAKGTDCRYVKLKPLAVSSVPSFHNMFIRLKRFFFVNLDSCRLTVRSVTWVIMTFVIYPCVESVGILQILLLMGEKKRVNNW